MNETVLWLLYLVSAVIAFLAVFRFGWPIVPSTLAGAFVSMVGWGVVYLLTAEELRPSFWRVDLSLSTCFGIIFAGAGAAVGFAVKRKKVD